MAEQKGAYTITERKILPHSLLSIAIEISPEEVRRFRGEAIAHLREHLNLDGFRKGHVPESVIVSRLGEAAVWEEAAERAIEEHVPEILAGGKETLVSQPRIQFTKLAPGNPTTLILTAAILPEFTMPDYKKIAREKNKIPLPSSAVEESELEKAIEDIRKNYARMTGAGTSAATEKHSGPSSEGPAAVPKTELPPLDDAFVKRIGDFKNVQDFKTKMKEEMTKEKEYRAKDKRRAEIADAIAGAVKVELPDALIENELGKMLARFGDDLARMGIKFSDYLKQIGKTELDLKKDWRPDAIKRATLELVIAKIAQTEKIDVPKERVDAEVEHLLSHYKEASPDRVRAYVESVISNEKVFEFLDNQK